MSLRVSLFAIFAVVLFLMANVFISISVAGDAQQICGDSSQFMKRRLASDEEVNLCSDFQGKVVLVVNTASRCGFTDQYDGLEKLYDTYKARGLQVVGFPSNDFANQEPGNEKQIRDFCRLTYGVKFPMYAKSHVKGEAADPFYHALAKASGEYPAWNFHKYLLSRDGRLLASYPSRVSPESGQLLADIEKALN